MSLIRLVQAGCLLDLSLSQTISSLISEMRSNRLRNYFLFTAIIILFNRTAKYIAISMILFNHLKYYSSCISTQQVNNLSFLIMFKEKEVKQLIPESQFLKTCSQCYVLLEKYKLKTNLVGINADKDVIDYAYDSYEGRIMDKYDKIYDSLKEGIQNLRNSFVIAQGNNLRVLNNILRNYRRRVGTLTNEPLGAFKYNRYDKKQKILLESMIYTQREQFETIESFKKEIAEEIKNGDSQIKERYCKSELIKENVNFIFDAVDNTQCYTYKYYENFERSMLSTINLMHSHFDKLNGYMSVWENVGSTKAYEVKSAFQISIQEKAKQNERKRKINHQATEEQLEEQMKSFPIHSQKRQQYKRMIQELRRYNNERQKKMENIGKMFNKRRNRAGILVNRNKEVNVLEWCINLENSKVPYDYSDEFKTYRSPENQQFYNEYRLTTYQSQKSIRNIEQIKLIVEKNQPTYNLSFQWYYDRFGKDGVFDLINTPNQQVQKKIQFEVIRQHELQNNDDRRKRELFQKQQYLMRQNEKRQSLHIGCVHAYDRDQLETLNNRVYHSEYIPMLYAKQDQSDIQFSDEQQQPKKEAELKASQVEPPQKQLIEYIHKIKEVPVQFIKLQNQEVVVQENIIVNKDPEIVEEKQCRQIGFYEQIITTYFNQYSKKITRKDAQPQFKKTKFFYYEQVSEIQWQIISEHIASQKIFIISKRVILYFCNIFSLNRRKIKCMLYKVEQQMEEDDFEDNMKRNITGAFKDIKFLTIKFQPIYMDEGQENLIPFMIGLLITLLKEGTMPEDYEIKNYINDGNDIIEDFTEYYYPQDSISRKNIFLRKYKVLSSMDIFQPKRRQIKKKDIDEDQKLATQIPLFQSLQHALEPKKEQAAPIQPKPSQKLVNQDQTIKLASVPHENQVSNLYNPMAQRQIELKKSNSRQFLNVGLIAIECKQAQEQDDNEGEDQDCEQL